MLFNSLHFLIFFPIVMLIYYIIPYRKRYLWLLVASYYFYMCWNAKYALLILFSTVVTYLSGIAIEQVEKRGGARCVTYKKLCVAASVVLNLGVLFFFKYANFAILNLNRAFQALHIELNMPEMDVLLPVGISFYTFQALSYTIDVYRKTISAEKNFLRYALFVSFFPQLVAGPIERSGNLLKQLEKPKRLQFEKFRSGLLLMLWGFFLKLVIADRIAIFVDTVYGNYEIYGGYYLIVATILFAFQIYCDFYGYSVIAMGTAQMLGIGLMENFDAPYLARSVAEFWRRWHISLSSWFKDYLYIPLGGSKKGTIRKCCNKLIVFLASGLWHGAQWNYVVWGGLNGLYQIIGEAMTPVRNRLVSIFRLDRNALSHKWAKMFGTFLLVDFSWIFFRAKSFSGAIEIIISMFSVKNPWILFDHSLYQCGLDRKNFQLMLLGILVLLFADACKYFGIKIREVIAKQEYWFQWIFLPFAAWVILLFGIWGSSYNGASFIYFQF